MGIQERTREKIAMDREMGALVALMTIVGIERRRTSNNRLRLRRQVDEIHAQQAFMGIQERTREKIAMDREMGALVALMTIVGIERRRTSNNRLRLRRQVDEIHAQ